MFSQSLRGLVSNVTHTGARWLASDGGRKSRVTTKTVNASNIIYKENHKLK